MGGETGPRQDKTDRTGQGKDRARKGKDRARIGRGGVEWSGVEWGGKNVAFCFFAEGWRIH